MSWLAFGIAVAVALLAGRRPAGTGAPGLRRTQKRACRWTRLDDAKRGFVPYRCETCGVTAYGRGDHEPALCKRDIDRPGGP